MVRRCRVGGPSTKCKDGAGANTSHGISTKKGIEQKHQVFSHGRDFNKETVQIHVVEVEVPRKDVMTRNTRNTTQSNFKEETKRPFLNSGRRQLDEICFDRVDDSREVTSLQRQKTRNDVKSNVEDGVSQQAHKLGQDKIFPPSGRHAVITKNGAPYPEKINGCKTDSARQLVLSPTHGSEKVVKPNEIASVHERLTSLYDKVLIVDSVPVAKRVVWMLKNWYGHLVHACDTEV